MQTKAFLTYMSTTFSYGFYRQWNTEMEYPYDLFGHRVISSISNGILYFSIPFGCFKLFNAVNRLDIAYHQKDKTKYKDSYSEIFGVNYNTF